MKYLISIFITFTFASLTQLSSQYTVNDTINIYSAPILDKQENDELYVTSEDGFVFLVNDTPNEIISEKFKSFKQAKDSNGNWKDIERYNYSPWGFHCGTGVIYHKYKKLPSREYTWSEYSSEPIGQYCIKTNVRYGYSFNDTIIYAETTLEKINIEEFLPPKARFDFLTKKGLLSDEYNGRNNIKSIIKYSRVAKAANLWRFGFATEAWKEIKNLNQIYPNEPAVNSQYGAIMVRYFKKTEIDADSIEWNSILSKAISKWSKIKYESRHYKNAQNMIKVYQQYLMSFEEFKKLIVEKCELINNQWYCTCNFLNEKVEQKFK